MSWEYKGSNNIHFNYPSIMMDGRNFSSYDMAPLLDKTLKENANIRTNSEYRKYLQHNADSIIKNNQLSACQECGVYINIKSNINNQSPYIFNSTLSKDQPYGYETSDLKNIYLSRSQLNAQKYSQRYII